MKQKNILMGIFIAALFSNVAYAQNQYTPISGSNSTCKVAPAAKNPKPCLEKDSKTGLGMVSLLCYTLHKIHWDL